MIKQSDASITCWCIAFSIIVYVKFIEEVGIFSSYNFSCMWGIYHVKW